MLIADSLSPEQIEIAETAENAADVIGKLSIRIAAALNVETQLIEDATLAREQTRTTAFRNGAAIPHCRLDELNDFGIAMMILKKPIRWDNEGHAVDTVMMLAGPSKQIPDQLRILANSSQLLNSSALRNKLKQAPNAEGACKLMVAAETAVEKKRSEEGLLRELHRDQGDSVDQLTEVVEGFEW